MKKLILLLLVLLLPLPSAGLAETTYTSGNYEYVLLEDGTAKITQYTGKEEYLVLPEKLDGYLVTGLDEDLLERNNTLFQEIKIPDCIVQLENNPFCYGDVVEITVSKNHPTLSTDNGVLFDKQMTRLIAYPQWHDEDTYHVPKGIKTIGKHAFYSAETSVIICSGSVDTIEDNAFHFARVHEIIFSEGLEKIGKYAFSESSLKAIELPDSVTSIGTGAFIMCLNLEDVTLPVELKKIEDAMFLGCWELKNVVMPKTLVSIGNEAFDNCDSLSKIALPDTVTDIGNNDENLFIIKKASESKSQQTNKENKSSSEKQSSSSNQGNSTRCAFCYGTGNMECFACGTFGMCGSCSGMGHTSRYTSDGYEYTTCFSCGGSGACWNCGYSGFLTCTYCGGSGKR